MVDRIVGIAVLGGGLVMPRKWLMSILFSDGNQQRINAK